MRPSILIVDYDYPLPANRIATLPTPQRDASKLLVYKYGTIEDATFYHLSHFLPPDSTLVLNNTRVIEARLHFEKDSGGVIEVFCLEPYEPETMEQAMQQTESVNWRCLIGGASKWKHGLVLQKELLVQGSAVTLEAYYVQKEEDSFIIRFQWNGSAAFAEVLHVAGSMPLPPYIKRKTVVEDAERYQTVFAAHNGSVAAPTAALHFTPQVFEQLSQKNIQPQYLTLHVGAGTFKPVKSETIAGHQMHAERFSVSMGCLKSLLQAKSIIAVGTTSLRALESLHWLGVKYRTQKDVNLLELGQWEAYDLMPQSGSFAESITALLELMTRTNQTELQCRTSLLIQPGYQFFSAAALVTNFHQPRSTLLLLVAAFIGDDWKKVYDHALQHDYRFLSYGDSSLLWRCSPTPALP